jgi:hypothetical protein
VHALFGWLQPARKVNFCGRAEREAFQRDNPWAASHPHVACPYFDHMNNNSIYIAPKQDSEEDRLILDGQDSGLKASGTFSTFEPEIHTLTLQGHSVSNWRLPSWFYRAGQPTLSMHTNLKRWSMLPGDPEHVQLQSVCRWQEFVFDSQDHDRDLVRGWVRRVVEAGRGRQ